MTSFEIFLLLSLYAAASVRLVPAINNITGSLSQMRNSYYSLQRVLSGLSSSVNGIDLQVHVIDGPAINESHKNSVKFKNVSFSYSNKEEKVFDSVSVDLIGSSLIALIGESGSGKSTAFDLILGFRSPDSGHITVGGLSFDGQERAMYDLLSYAPQEGFLFPGSVKDNVLLGREYDSKNFDIALEMSCLMDVIDALPAGIETVMSEDGLNFSGGQRQRISLARAIYSARPILLLDEPTSALDSETTFTFMQNLKLLSQSRLVIICTHDHEVMAISDRIIEVKDGKLIEAIKS
jgi:ABC-type bacteriocin/lantibiotic exporter with double-glycine peptidase domain